MTKSTNARRAIATTAEVIAAVIDHPVSVTETPTTAAAPEYTDGALREMGLDSLSARIRYLHAMGLKTAEITKIVRRSNDEAPRYQHVRNVILTPLKKVEATTSSVSGD